MEKKYPLKLFIIGFLMNVVGRFILLFLASFIFLVIGIWIKSCRIIGLGIFALDLLLSLIEQIRLRNAALHSDAPAFKEFQDAILSDNWQSNIKNILDDKTNSNHPSDE